MATEETKSQDGGKSDEKSSRIDKALQRFSEMMIERMEAMKGSRWEKGWTAGRAGLFGLPQNLSGRTYVGSNAFLLQMHTSMENYHVPVYMTIKQIREEGVRIKKGEPSVPVFKWGLSIKDENNKRISEDAYNSMSQEEKEKCKVHPYMQVFNEWNIDQTTLEETNKEKYDAFLARFQDKPINDKEGMYMNSALDRMFDKQEWVCKVQVDKEESGAYYSPSRDIVVVPMKEQFKIHDTPEQIFKDGQEYYSSALHEMAHSTGHESRLNRLAGGHFGDPVYAKEELVAELTAAMVGNSMGFDKRISDNSSAYLDSWISVLRREPKFIVSVMSDVNKASRMVLEKIDEQRVALGEKPLLQGNLDGVEEKEKNEQQMEKIKNQPIESKNDDNVQEQTKVETEIQDPKERFRTIVSSVTEDLDDNHHTLLEVKNLSELRNYYKDSPVIGKWMSEASDKEIIEAGADLLPNLRYSHKEGRTLHDMEAVFSNINARYEDVTDERTRQIAHRIEQAKNIITAYHSNIENSHEEGFLFKEESAHQMIPREEYCTNLTPLQAIGNKQERKLEPNKHETDLTDGVTPKEERQTTPHEDSNIQTDVAAKAEEIAATGVPMETAEKQAKMLSDNEEHESFHATEEKAEATAKDEERHKAEEKAEAQRKSAEEAKRKQTESQNADKEEAPLKTVTHTAILFGALELAKRQEGVWMNKNGKSNAEFLHSSTPITAYNNIMMNLEADQKGYRSNIFTYYNMAKENDMPVKKYQQSMPFNWTKWDYQNIMDSNDIISKQNYDKLPDDEKTLYEKHATRISQHIYNIDQTTFPVADREKYVALLKEKGAQEEVKATTAASRLTGYDDIQKKHPDVVILMRNNDFYESYRNNAKVMAGLLGLSLTKKEIEGKSVDYASFPHQQLDTALPKLIRSGNRVAIVDQLDNPRLKQSGSDGKTILGKAYDMAQTVAKQSGMKYERVMVPQNAVYDKKEDKIIVSGMLNNPGNERQAAILKANDIYRAVVASTGTENRLDRSGRNGLLPEDDTKHERLVQEIAAGVLMARQGLPATMSKESQALIPYWEREIKENPKMMGIIERDVNNAVETIDNLMAKRKVNYEAIRGQMPSKVLTEHSMSYRIATDLAKLPDIESKFIVIVKDKNDKKADVILPAGASLEADNEVPGMRKDRITIALKKEGVEQVRFYNAGGSLGLNQPDSYFKGKEVTLSQLKQYELKNHQVIDVSARASQENKVNISKFQAIKDDNGRYAFFIKPHDAPSFSVYPVKEHLNAFFKVINTPQQETMHNALATKYYELATKFPDTKVDLITPRKVDVDMNRIVRPTITSSAQDNRQKIIIATIDGKREVAPITKQQWNKMWLADDMAAYKKAVAAVVFEPVLKKGLVQEQKTVQEEKAAISETSTSKKKEDADEKVSTSKSIHI